MCVFAHGFQEQLLDVLPVSNQKSLFSAVSAFSCVSEEKQTISVVMVHF